MLRKRDEGSMSGIEILGLVASASQLALYSIKITTCLAEICKRVQDAPVRIRQHSDQIRQLQSTVQLVQQNHLLQTAHVYAHINATLEQAKTLSAILEQLTKDYSRGSIRKYWKILKASREKEILDIFDRLEKEKSALILCISVIQMDQLGQGIVKMEMAEKEARQNSAVAEKGDKVSLSHLTFCRYYGSSDTPLGNVIYRMVDVWLTSLKEGNQITDDIAPNEERTVPATSLRQGPNGVNLSLGQTQRGQGESNRMPFEEVADAVNSRLVQRYGRARGSRLLETARDIWAKPWTFKCE